MKAIANDITRALVQGLDLANTILGGMSEANFTHEEENNVYTIKIKTPGLGPDNYSIDIKNNVLYMYSLMNTDGMNFESKAPYLMRHFTLPFFVDLDAVEADFYDGTLKVTLPFNHLKDGFERKIEIK